MADATILVCSRFLPPGTAFRTNPFVPDRLQPSLEGQAQAGPRPKRETGLIADEGEAVTRDREASDRLTREENQRRQEAEQAAAEREHQQREAKARESSRGPRDEDYQRYLEYGGGGLDNPYHPANLNPARELGGRIIQSSVSRDGTVRYTFADGTRSETFSRDGQGAVRDSQGRLVEPTRYRRVVFAADSRSDDGGLGGEQETSAVGDAQTVANGSQETGNDNLSLGNGSQQTGTPPTVEQVAVGGDQNPVEVAQREVNEANTAADNVQTAYDDALAAYLPTWAYHGTSREELLEDLTPDDRADEYIRGQEATAGFTIDYDPEQGEGQPAHYSTTGSTAEFYRQHFNAEVSKLGEAVDAVTDAVSAIEQKRTAKEVVYEDSPEWEAYLEARGVYDQAIDRAATRLGGYGEGWGSSSESKEDRVFRIIKEVNDKVAAAGHPEAHQTYLKELGEAEASLKTLSDHLRSEGYTEGADGQWTRTVQPGAETPTDGAASAGPPAVASIDTGSGQAVISGGNVAAFLADHGYQQDPATGDFRGPVTAGGRQTSERSDVAAFLADYGYQQDPEGRGYTGPDLGTPELGTPDYATFFQRLQRTDPQAAERLRRVLVVRGPESFFAEVDELRGVDTDFERPLGSSAGGDLDAAAEPLPPPESGQGGLLASPLPPTPAGSGPDVPTPISLEELRGQTVYVNHVPVQFVDLVDRRIRGAARTPAQVQERTDRAEQEALEYVREGLHRGGVMMTQHTPASQTITRESLGETFYLDGIPQNTEQYLERFGTSGVGRTPGERAERDARAEEQALATLQTAQEEGRLTTDAPGAPYQAPLPAGGRTPEQGPGFNPLELLPGASALIAHGRITSPESPGGAASTLSEGRYQTQAGLLTVADVALTAVPAGALFRGGRTAAGELVDAGGNFIGDLAGRSDAFSGLARSTQGLRTDIAMTRQFGHTNISPVIPPDSTVASLAKGTVQPDVGRLGPSSIYDNPLGGPTLDVPPSRIREGIGTASPNAPGERHIWDVSRIGDDDIGPQFHEPGAFDWLRDPSGGGTGVADPARTISLEARATGQVADGVPVVQTPSGLYVPASAVHPAFVQPVGVPGYDQRVDVEVQPQLAAATQTQPMTVSGTRVDPDPYLRTTTVSGLQTQASLGVQTVTVPGEITVPGETTVPGEITVPREVVVPGEEVTVPREVIVPREEVTVPGEVIVPREEVTVPREVIVPGEEVRTVPDIDTAPAPFDQTGLEQAPDAEADRRIQDSTGIEPEPRLGQSEEPLLPGPGIARKPAAQDPEARPVRGRRVEHPVPEDAHPVEQGRPLQPDEFPRQVAHEEVVLDVDRGDGSVDRVLVDVGEPRIIAADPTAPPPGEHIAGNQRITASGKTVLGESVNPELPPRDAAERHPDGQVEEAVFVTDLDTGESTVHRSREPKQAGETLEEQLERVSAEELQVGGTREPAPRRSNLELAQAIQERLKSVGGSAASLSSRSGRATWESGRALVEKANAQADRYAPETKAAVLEQARRLTGAAVKARGPKRQPPSFDRFMAGLIKSQGASPGAQKNAPKKANRRSSQTGKKDRDIKKIGRGQRKIVVYFD